MIDEPQRPVNRASHAVPHPRIGIRKPRIMRENKIKGSRSIDGGILVYPRKEAPGKWMVMWRTPEGRRYRSFDTLTSANFFASDLQQERRHNGTKPVHSILTAAESKFLEELRAATKGAKLSEILAAWKDYQGKQSGLTIGEVAQRFVDMRSKEGVARFLQTNYALYLRRFIEMYGSKRSVNSFTPDDIRGWVGRLLKSGYSPKTVNHHLRTLSMVFNRSIAEGWASKNPCLAVASIKTERDEVSVLPLADARKLFEASRGHRVALYLALEAFGGLRFSSALRIAPGDINVADKSIVLPAAKHKTGRRHVLEGLPENLWEWIRNADIISDPLWKKNPWRMCVPVYNREKKAAFERAGLKLQPNVLRHSFCSYHVAQHQDAAKTAVLMQHSNQVMIYRHYKGVATRADAAEYFAITPSSFGPLSVGGRRRGRPRKLREGSNPAGAAPSECVSAEPA